MDVKKSADHSKLTVTPIQSDICLGNFLCGDRDIDDWAKKSLKHHNQDRVRVFCVRARNSSGADGFYSLSFSPINNEHLFDNHADRYKSAGYAPIVYIERLAVSRPMQNRGIGTYLLMDSLLRAYEVSKNIAVYGVALRSLNDKTTQFYSSWGFVQRDDNQNPLMILPIWLIRDLVKNNPSQ